MRVLITGAGGFIGSTLLRRVPPDWHVYALTRSAMQARPGLIPVTLEAIDGLGELDVLLHLAGNADHGLAIREPWRDLEATAVLGARILSSARARRVVVLSSAAVYAGQTGLVDPTVCVHPPMPYALSKLYLEGFVDALAARGVIGSALIIRLYNAFGPGERKTRLIPKVVEAARSGTPFRLTGDSASLSDPVHVDDVVTVLIAAAMKDVTGTFDLSGGHPLPLLDRIRRIASAVGHPDLPVEVVPNTDEIPIRFWSTPDTLTTSLGTRPVEPFDSALLRYAEGEGWLGPASSASGPTRP